jgi:hypothetical protein
MRTRRNDISILRCEEDGCGVSFMLVKGPELDEKIGLAVPQRVDRNPGSAEELTGVCGRHTGR